MSAWVSVLVKRRNLRFAVPAEVGDNGIGGNADSADLARFAVDIDKALMTKAHLLQVYPHFGVGAFDRRAANSPPGIKYPFFTRFSSPSVLSSTLMRR